MNNEPDGGAVRIFNERIRQVNAEGYTPEHDDEHDTGELLAAAIAYINEDPREWPWDGEPKLKGDRLSDLTKAGALVAAEIDRLIRVQSKKSPELLDAERVIEELRKQNEILQTALQNMRQELQEIRHPRVWGYDG